MPEVLSQLSNALADVVAAASEVVVRVDGRRRLPASGIVWADGVVVTTHHSLERDDDLRLGLPDGRTVSATLAGRDPSTDLAVLRTETRGLKTAAVSSLEGLRVGHLALALGRPGQAVQATLGVVKALGEAWTTRVGSHIDRYLESDIVMYPGFSGGPLVDVEGQVLGLNTSALLRGVTLTVPSPTVRRTVEQLLAQGRIRRGYLGVGMQPVALPADLAGRLGQEGGLLLVSVEPDSPANRAGLTLGDTLLAAEGQSVRHLEDLLRLLSAERIGQELSLRILRGGQVLQITVTVGERT